MQHLHVNVGTQPPAGPGLRTTGRYNEYTYLSRFKVFILFGFDLRGNSHGSGESFVLVHGRRAGISLTQVTLALFIYAQLLLVVLEG